MFPAVHPHVVLLDLGMPEMDGFEVCRRIRQAPGSEAVLIVIISGYEQEEHKVKAVEAGANYYFVKPFDPAKLLILIEQHFATE
jgi:DNA-binding response OmpR family regulator